MANDNYELARRQALQYGVSISSYELVTKKQEMLTSDISTYVI